MNFNDTTKLMEQVVGRKNMAAGYRNVVANAGAGGIDKMPVNDLRD